MPPFIARMLPSFVLRFAGRLRFPQLFLLAAALFIVDLLVPDFIPFVDEILLGLLTLILGNLRSREAGSAGAAVDGEGRRVG